MLALAFRELPKLQHQNPLPAALREELESDLTPCGLACFSSKLKDDTLQVIEELRNAGIPSVMITGDHVQTALAVSRQLGILAESNSRMEHPKKGDSNGGAVVCSDVELLRSVLAVPADRSRQSLDLLKHTRVYARATPEQKEQIVHAYQKLLGKRVLMCGDGTNDVAALKHAEVGMAILSKPLVVMDGSQGSAVALPERYQKMLENPLLGAAQKERMRQMLEQMHVQQLENQQYMLKMGDASIAAPFTSKRSSIRCAVDVIRQGRCTLVSTMQVYAILALNCLVNAYTLSVLYLKGLKFGDRQMTVSSLFIAACFLFISRAKPSPVLSKKKPESSIFGRTFLLSVFGQFVIHLTSLLYIVSLVDEQSLPKLQQQQRQQQGSFPAVEALSEFEPGMLNTVVFPFSCIMQLVTFVVNYTGPPFMSSIWENKPFVYAAGIAGIVFTVAATGQSPEINELLQMVEVPARVSMTIVGVIVSDVLGVFLWRGLVKGW